MLSPLPYTLPDFAIFHREWEDYRFFTWQPDKIYIIIGTSNKPEQSLNIENVLNDDVPVLKRPSGGEAVILSPNTLVIATTIYEDKLRSPAKYFNTANTKLIYLLEQQGVKNLSLKGISDIATGEKKIAGSSIYRRLNKVFYHAVLNVSESPEIMEKYLTHPHKEPDYRKSRNHKDFVTSLLAEGYNIDIQELARQIAN